MRGKDERWKRGTSITVRRVNAWTEQHILSDAKLCFCFGVFCASTKPTTTRTACRMPPPAVTGTSLPAGLAGSDAHVRQYNG